jgi:hypothetical protein
MAHLQQQEFCDKIKNQHSKYFKNKNSFVKVKEPWEFIKWSCNLLNLSILKHIEK